MKYPLTDLLIRPSRLPINAYIKGHKAYIFKRQGNPKRKTTLRVHSIDAILE